MTYDDDDEEVRRASGTATASATGAVAFAVREQRSERRQWNEDGSREVWKTRRSR